jgi:hypothetical protein
MADEFHRCLNCGRVFDPAKPRSYLRVPLPGAFRIIMYVIITSVISIAAAFVVSLFQLSAASGH